MNQEILLKGKRRGVAAERELVTALWKLGFAVIRGPASGARIKKSIYPDIVAIKNKHIFVIEVKKRSKLTHIYVDVAQVEKLREFARRADGKAIIAVKITGLGTWKIIPVECIIETCGKKLKIDKEMIKKAEDFETYFNKRITKSLDNYILK